MDEKRLENDRYLVEACVKRDLLAWARFVKKYSTLVSSSIENRVKRYGFPLPHQDIEDIRQDVFASIWKDGKLAGIAKCDSLPYWLAIVAGNAAMMHLRKKHVREASATLPLFDDSRMKELFDTIPSGTASPPDELDRNKLSEKIDKAIASLPPKEKLIIKLHLVHNKKYHEIASILRLPGGTISNYIKRAKEKLRKRLKEFR